MEFEKNRISRRNFLKTSATGIGALVVGPAVFAAPKNPASPKATARVVDVRSPAWRKADGRTVDTDVVREMIATGIKTLTGKRDEAAAWREIVSPTETVALKFNAVSGDYTRANQAIIDAVTEALMDVGVDRRKIIVVEANPAQFKGGRPDLTFGPPIKIADKKTRLTRFLTDQIDCIINFPNIKDHRLAGVTGSLKNLSQAGRTFMDRPSNFHANCCDPYIALMVARPEFKNKLRLNISNGLMAVFEGGPGTRRRDHQWPHNGFLFGTDPVAMDRVSLELIEAVRKAKGKPSLFKTSHPPKHLFTAAKLGLGEIDLKKIEWIKAKV